MKGSIGLYYAKHIIHTWIKKIHKLTKTLVVEFSLFVYIITYVMVMTRNIIFDSALSGHKESSAINIIPHK